MKPGTFPNPYFPVYEIEVRKSMNSKITVGQK